jgi:hypothetical protein
MDKGGVVVVCCPGDCVVIAWGNQVQDSGVGAAVQPGAGFIPAIPVHDDKRAVGQVREPGMVMPREAVPRYEPPVR